MGRQDDDYDDDFDEEEEDIELISFQGAMSGKAIDLASHGRLAQVALSPTKELITDAILRRAEMLRIEPRGEKSAVHLVVDTIPYPGPKLPGKHALAITQMLKLLSAMDVNERAKPQAGGINAEYEERKYLILINTTPVKGGERVTIRIRDLNNQVSKPEEVGISADLKARLRELTSSRSGIILAAGGAGSGVTTTSFALLQGIDTYIYSVFTVTDTEGRDITNISAFEVKEDEPLKETLARCIRVEADVIFTEPVRSKEIAQTLFDYSDQVCLIAEINAKDASSAIPGLAKVLGDPKKIAEGLRGVFSQKLIRVLCEECKEPFRPHPKLVAKAGLPVETKVLYRPPRYDDIEEGEEEIEPCEHCGGTGYYGRVGLFELIEMSDGVKEVLLKGGGSNDIRAQARKEDMPSYKDSGIQLVAQGRTSLEELQRVFSAK